MPRQKRKKKAKKIKKSRPKKKAARKPAARKTQKLKFEYRTTKALSPAMIQKLFRSAGWEEDLARYSARKVRAKLNRSQVVVTAWLEEEMVGFASAVSDGVLTALVDNLVVHPKLRGQGVGRSLMRRMGHELRAQGVDYVFALGTRSGKSGEFFEASGFRVIPWRVFLHARR